MSHTNLRLGSNWDKDEWPDYIFVTHDAYDGARYVVERTCHVEDSFYDELLDEDYTDLSCGHRLRGAEREFKFCSKCGARIVLCYNS